MLRAFSKHAQPVYEDRAFPRELVDDSAGEMGVVAQVHEVRRHPVEVHLTLEHYVTLRCITHHITVYLCILPDVSTSCLLRVLFNFAYVLAYLFAFY